MIKSLPGVTPKRRFGPIMDSTDTGNLSRAYLASRAPSPANATDSSISSCHSARQASQQPRVSSKRAPKRGASGDACWAQALRLVRI